jgi:putative transposase
VLEDFSQSIIAQKLRMTMKVGDVIDTLNLALIASGCDSVRFEHKPRLVLNRITVRRDTQRRRSTTTS